MGRHPANVMSQGDMGPRWSARYRLEWGEIVGGRVRRLRLARGWRLHDLSGRVPKPEGGWYSPGYFSRLERGWTTPSMYVYIATAQALEIAPGKLLGEEQLEQELTPEQALLLRFLQRAGIEPEEAIARLTMLDPPPVEQAPRAG